MVAHTCNPSTWEAVASLGCTRPYLIKLKERGRGAWHSGKHLWSQACGKLHKAEARGLLEPRSLRPV
jgi:hypothetical protein